jgi:hypothetical protein
MSKQSNSEAGETAQSYRHDLNLTKTDPRVHVVLEDQQSSRYLLRSAFEKACPSRKCSWNCAVGSKRSDKRRVTQGIRKAMFSIGHALPRSIDRVLLPRTSREKSAISPAIIAAMDAPISTSVVADEQRPVPGRGQAMVASWQRPRQVYGHSAALESHGQATATTVPGHEQSKEGPYCRRAKVTVCLGCGHGCRGKSATDPSVSAYPQRGH